MNFRADSALMTAPFCLETTPHDKFALPACRLVRSGPTGSVTPEPSARTVSFIRGTARQSVLTVLVASGYAIKCYLPGRVEYVLTEPGLTRYRAGAGPALAQRAHTEAPAIAPDSAALPA